MACIDAIGSGKYAFLVTTYTKGNMTVSTKYIRDITAILENLNFLIPDMVNPLKSGKKKRCGKTVNIRTYMGSVAQDQPVHPLVVIYTQQSRKIAYHCFSPHFMQIGYH